MSPLIDKEEEDIVNKLIALADGDIELFRKALRTAPGEKKKTEDVIRRILELKEEKNKVEEEKKFFEGIINSFNPAL